MVTGLGAVTPVGATVESSWKAILAGVSGAGIIEKFDPEEFSTKYACEVKFGQGSEKLFNPDDWMEKKERRKVDPFILYGVAAAKQAIRDSGWVAASEETQNRTGVIIGSGIGGLGTIADTSNLLMSRGPRRISPFFIPGSLVKP